MIEIPPPLLSILPEHLGKPLRLLLILLLGALAFWVANRVVPRLLESFVAWQGNAEEGQRLRTLSRVARYTLTAIAGAITVLLVLEEFGVSLAPILGAAGVVGIAVGFGAQSLVKDCFAGFFLLLENQIRLGDVVEAGGKSGTVEELTLRYLRLRDYSGNVHFVPNGSISVVTNMSVGFAFAVAEIGIAYSEEIDRALAIMRKVGAELRADPEYSARILDDLEIAGVENWGDSAIMLRCRLRVAPREQWNVRREFLRRLKTAFDAAGVEIPYPHLQLVRAERSKSPPPTQRS